MTERPLIITEDDELLDELLRLAAAAGVEVTHTPGPGSRAQWRAATLVLIGADQVPAAAAAGLPRRSGVVAVLPGTPEDGIFQACVVLGVERTLTLTRDEDTLVELIAAADEDAPSGAGRAVAVIGARGGAGASVFAVATAFAGIRAGSPVVLADVDPWGAGLDILVGMESAAGLRWPDLNVPSGRVPAQALHQALPAITGIAARGMAGRRHGGRSSRTNLHRLSLLCHDDRTRELAAETVDVVIESCRRGGELAVIDLPRAPTAAADRAAELADLVVLVVPADVPSCYAAQRLLDRLLPVCADIGLVVRGPSPGGLGADDVAATLGLPLIAGMRPQPGLDRGLELGRAPTIDGRGPLAVAAGKVLGHCGFGPGGRS